MPRFYTGYGQREQDEVKEGKFSLSRRLQVCRKLLDKGLYPDGQDCLSTPNHSESFVLTVGDIKVNISRRSGSLVSYYYPESDLLLRDITDTVANLADDKLVELLGDNFDKIATN